MVEDAFLFPFSVHRNYFSGVATNHARLCIFRSPSVHSSKHLRHCSSKNHSAHRYDQHFSDVHPCAHFSFRSVLRRHYQPDRLLLAVLSFLPCERSMLHLDAKTCRIWDKLGKYHSEKLTGMFCNLTLQFLRGASWVFREDFIQRSNECILVKHAESNLAKEQNAWYNEIIRALKPVLANASLLFYSLFSYFVQLVVVYAKNPCYLVVDPFQRPPLNDQKHGFFFCSPCFLRPRTTCLFKEYEERCSVWSSCCRWAVMKRNQATHGSFLSHFFHWHFLYSVWECQARVSV
jgi:hypothetical protein